MATYYLNADTGDNANAGTSALPWETITYAHTTATDGDTIILQTATAVYSPFAAFTKSLTFQGATTTPANHVISKGLSEYRPFDSATSDITITYEYIKFTGIEQTSAGWIYAHSAGDQTVNITNCVIDLSAVSGAGNFIYSGSGGTLYINITSTSISKTNHNWSRIIFGNAAACVATFIACTLYIDEININFFSVSNTPYAITISNSIFYLGVSTAFGSIGTGVLTTSCFYNATSIPAGTDNITTDPLFVDGANGNFNLRQTSPCLDTGTIL